MQSPTLVGPPVGPAQQQPEYQGGKENDFHRPKLVVDHIQQRQPDQAGGDGADHQEPGHVALADHLAPGQGDKPIAGNAKHVFTEVQHHR